MLMVIFPVVLGIILVVGCCLVDCLMIFFIFFCVVYFIFGYKIEVLD